MDLKSVLKWWILPHFPFGCLEKFYIKFNSEKHIVRPFLVILFIFVDQQNTARSQSQTYSSPSNSYSAPQNSYSAPEDSYSAPSDSYSSPGNSYSAPEQSYSSPENAYSAPKNTYSSPGMQYEMLNFDIYLTMSFSFLK